MKQLQTYTYSQDLLSVVNAAVAFPKESKLNGWKEEMLQGMLFDGKRIIGGSPYFVTIANDENEIFNDENEKVDAAGFMLSGKVSAVRMNKEIAKKLAKPLDRVPLKDTVLPGYVSVEIDTKATWRFSDGTNVEGSLVLPHEMQNKPYFDYRNMVRVTMNLLANSEVDGNHPLFGPKGNTYINVMNTRVLKRMDATLKLLFNMEKEKQLSDNGVRLDNCHAFLYCHSANVKEIIALVRYSVGERIIPNVFSLTSLALMDRVPYIDKNDPTAVIPRFMFG